VKERNDTFTISDLANELDISTRTIRYYEEIGLIEPIRTERGTRLYTRSDRARLRLILRGKRLGFTLEQIKEMIDLFREDLSGKKQLERTIEYGTQKIAEVERHIQELTLLKEELLMYKEKFAQKLAELSKQKEEQRE
jgi:DNA-binding transcriptional MerR regulator